jgi:hypothetical protein
MVRECASPPSTARRCLLFGACPLTFAEDLLIGAAGLLFPDDLLNDEGVNRAGAVGEVGGAATGTPSGGAGS